MEHYLASFAEWVLFIQGLVFVVVVMSFRKGIVGQWQASRKLRREREQNAAAAALRS